MLVGAQHLISKCDPYKVTKRLALTDYFFEHQLSVRETYAMSLRRLSMLLFR
jgi:hypothetical protein